VSELRRSPLYAAADDGVNRALQPRTAYGRLVDDGASATPAAAAIAGHASLTIQPTWPSPNSTFDPLPLWLSNGSYATIVVANAVVTVSLPPTYT
jgi:hypothetical protein